MRYPRGVPSHGRLGCCPDEWDRVPNLSGSHEMDGVIKRSTNADVPARLKLYCGRENAYGSRTSYNGYTKGYTGDN